MFYFYVHTVGGKMMSLGRLLTQYLNELNFSNFEKMKDYRRTECSMFDKNRKSN